MSAMQKRQAQFAHDIALFILAVEQLGYEVVCGEFYRPPETAHLYETQGRGISKSLHTTCLAADLNLFKDGIWLKNTPDYREAGELWESYGPDHNWGGRFKTLPDGNHFSLSFDGNGFEGVR